MNLTKEQRAHLLEHAGDMEATGYHDDAKALRSLLAAPSADDARRMEVLEQKLYAERFKTEHLVNVLSRIHSFVTMPHVRLPDGRVFEFNNPKIEHEMLHALSEAIRAVPDELARIAPAADDAGISEASIAACALMIKGICMTHTQDVWTTKIAERIKFMLIAAPTPEDAPSAAQGVTLTDEQIDAIVRKACHSDPVTADGEYCLTVDEIRNLLAAAKPASVDAPPASGATRDYAKSDAEFESKTGRSLDLTGNFYQIDRIDGEADAPYRERIRPVRAAWLRRMRNCYR